ncbi:hypothetical protein ACQRXC_28910 (plasmid) [Niallia taxi]|uniref:hypothetical protein n=1 Tax=Niallia TaxID=2837506 RepID=UPI0015F540F4|nr:hypothetical protein [Niallia taxi]MED4057213.1 hypothetical protein [Niallia taxi]MED4122190.1 hypothetical protein [Niallia taxi]
MSQNTQSKILSIDEQIKKLQDKKKREITKLERSTGKKFLEKFNLENKSLDEIYSFMDTLELLTKDSLSSDSASDVNNGQSAQ